MTEHAPNHRPPRPDDPEPSTYYHFLGIALRELLIEAIVEAKENLEPACIGIAKNDLALNRNRHTTPPKPTDPALAAVRFDSEDGKPLAIALGGFDVMYVIGQMWPLETILAIRVFNAQRFDGGGEAL